MKEQDRARFRANLQWFNQFFDGMRMIYDLVLEQLPVEFFPTKTVFTNENYHFPRNKVVPSIPPYYAFLICGPKYGLQILTIIDASLIAREGFFFHEPSIISVVHTQADKNTRLDELAMNVVGNRKIELIQNAGGIIWGRIKLSVPTHFFAFQVALDEFSETDNTQSAVHKNIILPLTENLHKGFLNPSN